MIDDKDIFDKNEIYIINNLIRKTIMVKFINYNCDKFIPDILFNLSKTRH